MSGRGLGAAVVLMALAAYAGYSGSPAVAPACGPTVAADMFVGRVTRIVDGDTFWINSKDDPIRIWGLDAPEVGTAGGSAARLHERFAALERMIEIGRRMRCTRCGSGHAMIWHILRASPD